MKAKWIKFSAPEDAYQGAHRSLDGKVVGLFTPAGIDSLTGQQEPARINVVTKDFGHNLVELHEGEVRNVTLNPAQVQFVLANVPEDCPAKRVSHLLEI